MLWAYVVIWLYVSPIPAAWAVFFFRIRRGSIPRRWVRASLVATFWLPYLVQYRLWKRRQEPGAEATWVDSLEGELHALYPS